MTASKPRLLFGPPPKGQEWDDEVFETLKVKVPDHVHYAVIICWILSGISAVISLLTFMGIFMDNKSFFIVSGLMSLILMASAVSGILSFRWKQRHLLLTSAVLNVVWLTLTINQIICYALLSVGWTRFEFKRDVMFHIVMTVTCIGSILLSIAHFDFYYVLLLEKDPSFFKVFHKKDANEVTVLKGSADEDGERSSTSTATSASSRH